MNSLYRKNTLETLNQLAALINAKLGCIDSCIENDILTFGTLLNNTNYNTRVYKVISYFIVLYMIRYFIDYITVLTLLFLLITKNAQVTYDYVIISILFLVTGYVNPIVPIGIFYLGKIKSD